MEFIRVTKENLEKEHICCAISNNKDVQVLSKKSWLEQRFDEGLVFLKSNNEINSAFVLYNKRRRFIVFVVDFHLRVVYDIHKFINHRQSLR